MNQWVCCLGHNHRFHMNVLCWHVGLSNLGGAEVNFEPCWAIAGSWPPLCSQFPCGVHWWVASSERQVPEVPLLCLPKPWLKCPVKSPGRFRSSFCKCCHGHPLCACTASWAEQSIEIAGSASHDSHREHCSCQWWSKLGGSRKWTGSSNSKLSEQLTTSNCRCGCW